MVPIKTSMLVDNQPQSRKCHYRRHFGDQTVPQNPRPYRRFSPHIFSYIHMAKKASFFFLIISEIVCEGTSGHQTFHNFHLNPEQRTRLWNRSLQSFGEFFQSFRDYLMPESIPTSIYPNSYVNESIASNEGLPSYCVNFSHLVARRKQKHVWNLIVIARYPTV